jgi:TonB family protein
MIRLLMSVVILLLAAQSPTKLATQDECSAEQSQATRVWTKITPAVVKTRVEPAWPNPHHNDTHGTILLDVWIDEKGNVSCVKITRSIPINDQAAVNAVRQWKFVPATLRGRPIAVVQEVQIPKP